jgi:hypothetical protein
MFENKCSLCFNNYENNTHKNLDTTLVLCCNSHFHTTCILRWEKENVAACPNCDNKCDNKDSVTRDDEEETECGTAESEDDFDVDDAIFADFDPDAAVLAHIESAASDERKRAD